MARPSSYTPKKAALILDALSGLAGKGEAAKAAGISRKTLYNWRDANPDFAEALEDVDEGVTDLVESSALRKAIREGDTTMQIFLLKTRRRDIYGDRQTLEHTGKDGAPLTITIAERSDGPS